MRHLYFAVVTILQFISFWMNATAADVPLISTPSSVFIETVWVEEGGSADLPCDISTVDGDRINMILWYKDSTAVPIYSLDGRNVHDLSDGTHLATSGVGNRCYFVVNKEEDKKSHLTISKIKADDEGIYKCRIDFFNSPTRIFKVNLTLITLPTMPSIITDQGREVTTDVIGPYLEGSILHLTCRVYGGKPKPRISWWLNGEKLNGSSIQPTSKSEVSSRLLLHSIPRYYNNKYLQCQANLENTSSIVSKIVRLDIYVRPISVAIRLADSNLISGKSEQIVCECTGSNPAPNFYWLLGEESIVKHTSVSLTENQAEEKARSILTLKPEASDNGKYLNCKCENPEFPADILEDKKMLEVTYPPIPKIILISKTNTNSLTEGSDLVMDCMIDANPSANGIIWYHNGQVIKKSSSSKTELKIASVTKDQIGEYVCEAFNDVGSLKSKPKNLKILYAPICRDTSVYMTILAMKKEIVILNCEVDSEADEEGLKFYWTFNNSKDTLPIPSENFETSGQMSILKFTPLSDSDFGSFGCWAENSIGKQQTPCIFRVIPAKKPDKPENCTVQNELIDQLKISCYPGFDGGLKQFFLLEVRLSNSDLSIKEPFISEFTSSSDQLSDQAGSASNTVSDIEVNQPLYSFKGETPTFDLLSLEPGYSYMLTIYAVNVKGKSEPVIIFQEMKSIAKPIDKVVLPAKSSSSNNNIGIISSSSTTITVPTAYIMAVVFLIILILFLILTIGSILACKRKESNKREKMERELNHIRLMFSDEDKLDSSHVNFETEF